MGEGRSLAALEAVSLRNSFHSAHGGSRPALIQISLFTETETSLCLTCCTLVYDYMYMYYHASLQLTKPASIVQVSALLTYLAPKQEAC